MSTNSKVAESPQLAYAMVVLTTFLWALSTVVGRGINEILPPVGVSFCRWIVAALAILPLAWPLLRKHMPLIRKNLGLLLLLGILQVGSSTLLFVGLNYTTAINTALINAAQPLLTVIPAWFLAREQVTPKQFFGICLGMFGVILVITRSDFAALLTFSFNIGDIIVLVGVLGWSVYAALIHKAPREIGLPAIVFCVFFLGSLVLLPFFIIESLYFEPLPITPFSIWIILFLGIVISAVSIAMWSHSLRIVGPTKASIFINLIPIFATGLAIAFLGEQLLLFHIYATVLIAAGMYFVISR